MAWLEAVQYAHPRPACGGTACGPARASCTQAASAGSVALWQAAPGRVCFWKLEPARMRTAATSSTRSPASVAGLVDVREQVAAALVKELGVIEVELGGALVPRARVDFHAQDPVPFITSRRSPSRPRP